ncbi:hypothetical protein DFQ27_005494 [Actinomortierella ambigua]|uniref:Crinkler effector protein N-terminal domain-containing protein n=1 Tax=Actinomortierella ambigua TaxID=1343610 RepID=A0A9P6U1S0_9FUNG|nr:hypothetical protein DFQ27_005494 [Actinomortierella ambigua]
MLRNMTTPTTLLTLFCLVDGEANSFPVDIEPSKTVAHLKEFIKAKIPDTLNGVDAKDLNLWCVSIPASEDDDKISILIDNVISDRKKKLSPLTRLSKVFPDELPEETIHILIQRPAPQQSDALQPEIAALRKQLSDITQLNAKLKNTSITLGIIEKRGGKKIVCRYMADTKTATLEGLQQLLKEHFEQFEGDDYLQIFAYTPGNSLPVMLTTDGQLRSMLEIAKEEGWKNLTISLDSPAKSFSKYTWPEVVSQYGIRETPGLIPAFDIQPKTLTGGEREVLEHIVKDCTFKNNSYVFDKLASELTRSSIVDTFMVAATQLHKSNLFLAQQRQMSGMRGHGPVDFAVVDRVHQNQVLGVTEVKTGEEFVQGMAQNIVQLDVAVQQKKRKRTDDDDETGERPPTRFKSFGIVTDSYNWTLLECTLDEDDRLSYRVNEVVFGFEKNLRGGEKELREGCENVFGYVLALFDLIMDEIVNRSSYNSPVSRSSSSKLTKRIATGASRP